MANLFFLPYRPAYDNAGGLVVPGAQVHFTNTGGTAKPVYSDSGLTTPRTNPVVADGVGKLPTGIYMDPAITYRVRIYARGAVVGVDTPLQDFNPYVPGVFADAAALQPVADAAAASAADASDSASAADASAAAAAADAASAHTSAVGVDAAAAAVEAALDGSAFSVAQLKDGLPWNPDWFGAAGDGATDDNASFQELAYEDRGHSSVIPSVQYRIGTPNIYRGLVTINGSGWGQNPGDVDGVNYPFPTFFNGSIILSDANVTGLEFQPFTSETDVATVLADLAGHKTQQSAYGSIVSGVAVISAGNGAAHAGKRGLYSRTRIHVSNAQFYGHGAEGVRIEGSSDSPDGHAYGNANLTSLASVDATGNAGDGFYFGGRDMNASLFVGLNASNNGGWGFQDQGLLGNTYVACHAAGNVSGSFRSTSAVAPHLYLGCYDEIDSGKLTNLTAACMVIGGSLAFDACHPANSPAFVLNAGEAIRKGISGLNNLNATNVRAGLGRDPSVTASGKIAMWFGTPVDPGGTSDEHRLKYEFEWTGVWAWTYRNALSYMEFPSGQASWYASLANPMAVGFPQGLAMGTMNSAPRICPAAAAAPVAGTYRRGDVVYNNAPSASGFIGWVCVSAGTPGTWKTFGPISA